MNRKQTPKESFATKSLSWKNLSIKLIIDWVPFLNIVFVDIKEIRFVEFKIIAIDLFTFITYRIKNVEKESFLKRYCA